MVQSQQMVLILKLEAVLVLVAAPGHGTAKALQRRRGSTMRKSGVKTMQIGKLQTVL